MDQFALFSGFYHCPSCGSPDETALLKVRRFRVCLRCYARYVPPDPENPTVEQGTAFWEWYGALEKRYPAYYSPSRRHETQLAGLNYCPVCECGREIGVLEYVPSGAPVSLFGPPRHQKCERCEIEEDVTHLATSTLRTVIKPNWDDEDWLDYLYKTKPRAFQLGILPDLWFRLKGGAECSR